MNCSKCGKTLKEKDNLAKDGVPICVDCFIAKLPKANQNAGIQPKAAAAPMENGIMCDIHPSVPAVRYCSICSKPMCSTCEFSFEDSIYVCPKCINKPDSLSDKRKKYLLGSYGCAAGAVISFLVISVASISVLSGIGETLVGYLLMFFVLGPAIAGIVLGTNASKKKKKKPFAVKTAVGLNIIVVVGFILLSIVGLAMQ